MATIVMVTSEVSAFHDAAPAAMSFTQAMTNCTARMPRGCSWGKMPWLLRIWMGRSWEKLDWFEF
jgi:hypothetical protein